MALLEQMFFITKNLFTSNVEEYFVKLGFGIQDSNDGYFIFSKESESFLLKKQNNEFNYCKVILNDETRFRDSLMKAIKHYAFVIIEDEEIKVLRNDEFTLLFSQYKGMIFNITLAKRSNKLEDFSSVKAISVNQL